VLRRTQDHRPSSHQFRLQGSHLLWRLFPVGFGYRSSLVLTMSCNPARACLAVWASSLSLATTREIISFPEGTEMFQFPSFPPPAYLFNWRRRGASPAGFPIRISSDIALAHSSPRLFAVYHVLHRHLSPRHPPCALCSLLLLCVSIAMILFLGVFSRSRDTTSLCTCCGSRLPPVS
jgi:hypothetical protein